LRDSTDQAYISKLKHIIDKLKLENKKMMIENNKLQSTLGYGINSFSSSSGHHTVGNHQRQKTTRTGSNKILKNSNYDSKPSLGSMDKAHLKSMKAIKQRLRSPTSSYGTLCD
jgi:regulator of replication initiation timing